MQQALDIVKNKFPDANYSLNKIEEYVIGRGYNVDNIVLSIITIWVRAGNSMTTKRMSKRMSTAQIEKNFMVLCTCNAWSRELVVDYAVKHVGIDMARLRWEE